VQQRRSSRFAAIAINAALKRQKRQKRDDVYKEKQENDAFPGKRPNFRRNAYRFSGYGRGFDDEKERLAIRAKSLRTLKEQCQFVKF
jgi:hypothetical protein